MNELASTKPYMIRAIHEWCTDNGLTPHILVAVDGNVRVPMAYVKDGEIVLNVNFSATRNLLIGNEAVTFSARFGGVANDLYVPMHAVRGIFARENGQGMFFQPELANIDVAEMGVSDAEELLPEKDGFEDIVKPLKKKPFLKLVK
jgi:stringent starvation protein B